MRVGYLVLSIGALAGIAYSQTTLDLRTQARNVDFSAATTTKPSRMGTALPAVCGVGETFFKTTAPAGQNLFICASANTWSQVGSPPPDFSNVTGIASLGQGGTGGATAAAARANLGAAAATHTHAVSDLTGITGKQGGGSLLQLFGGGTVNANDCARFDAAGNIISSGTNCGNATSLLGFTFDTSTPATAGQFYGWDAAMSKFSVYTLGSLLSLTGKTVNVATDSVPQYSSSNSVPPSCSQYGLFFFNTAGASGNKLYYCNGTAYEPVTSGSGSGSGLGDPGANGIVLRTALNTTTIAVPGTHYYAPGTAIVSGDLPAPTASAGGKVKATTCSTGNFVSAINTDSSVGCTAPSANVNSAQATTYTAGAKQSFQASTTTAGAQVACAALPSSPAAGDIACDSADGNKLKEWNGSSWLTFSSGGGGGGTADPGSNGIVARTGSGTAAARTIVAGSSNIAVTSGDGVSANPSIDLGTTVDLTTKTTLPNQVGLLSALPATCTVGQTYYASDGTPGRKLQFCTAANTWTPSVYDQGTGLPSTCSVGQIFFKTDAAAGQNLYFCTTSNTWTQNSGNVNSSQATTYTTGAKQSFQASSTTAGTQVTCAALPSSPAAGDIACDSGDGNKLKEWNGSSWLTLSFSGSGMSDPGSNGIVARTGSGTTAARTIVAGSSNLAVTSGDGVSANPSIDLGSTVDLRSKSTLPNQAGLLSALPSTCTVGQTYFASDGTPGKKLLFCTATNTWTASVYDQGTSLPSTCSAGQIFFKTDATAGQNLYYCTASNTWTQGGGGGNGSTWVCSNFASGGTQVTVASSSTVYGGFGATTVAGGNGFRAMAAPFSGTLRDLVSFLNTSSAAQPASGSLVVTVRTGATLAGLSPSTVVATFAASATAGTVASDHTHTVGITQDQFLDFSVQNNATATSAGISSICARIVQ